MSDLSFRIPRPVHHRFPNSNFLYLLSSFHCILSLLPSSFIPSNSLPPCSSQRIQCRAAAQEKRRTSINRLPLFCVVDLRILRNVFAVAGWGGTGTGGRVLSCKTNTFIHLMRPSSKRAKLSVHRCLSLQNATNFLNTIELLRKTPLYFWLRER